MVVKVVVDNFYNPYNFLYNLYNLKNYGPAKY